MKSKVVVAFACALSMVLTAACNRTPETPKVESTAGGTSTPTGDRSVALPQSSVPPSDASIPPPASASTQGSGDANSATQANPAELQKSQEQANMPMSGQVNNHSVPETGGPPK